MNKNEKVTRVEIIDKKGRSYVNMNVESLKLSYQDNDRTLKLFIKESDPGEEVSWLAKAFEELELAAKIKEYHKRQVQLDSEFTNALDNLATKTGKSNPDKKRL